jgi:lipopolysaccharide export system protein LptA
MKIFKKLLLFIFVISHYSYAEELKITAQKEIITENNKVHTYIGNVLITFSDSEHPEITSSSVSMVNGKTVMEGNVEIILNSATAVTNRVVCTKTQNGFLAKMDKVVVTYH